MYNAEVLSKFPVVQHFPFGSLFPFTPDPAAKKIQATVHTASLPKNSASTATTAAQPPLRDALADSSAPAMTRPLPPQGNVVGTAAPWATTSRAGNAQTSMAGGMPSTSAPWARREAAQGPQVPSGPDQPTKAPWVSRTPALSPPGSRTAAPGARGSGIDEQQQNTRAPWADKR